MAIATKTRDLLFDRVLSGNHDEPGTLGKLAQNLDAAVSSRSSHAAADVVTAFGTGAFLTSCLTATGFSTFDPATDKVYLANGAHGGAEASFTLADYSEFQGAAASVTVEGIAAAILANPSYPIVTDAAGRVTVNGGITITPAATAASSGEVEGSALVGYQGAAQTFAWDVVDENGTVIDLDGKDVVFLAVG